MNYGDIINRDAKDRLTMRQQAEQYLANRFALEAMMERIANGEKVTRMAKEIGVSYPALYSALVSTHRELYQAAKAAHAELLAEKNLDLADKVESLEVPHDAAKAAVGIRQWHMERSAAKEWGQKSTVDMNIKGVAGMHLEAIRQLASEPIEGEFEEVSDDDGLDADDAVGGWDGDPGGDGDGDSPGPAEEQPGRLKGEELL